MQQPFLCSTSSGSIASASVYRISYPEVQKAVNGTQSETETRAVLDLARASGFRSLNVDLIYGLPRQTLAGFGATLDKTIDAAPDRIGLFRHAHAPQLF